MNIQKRFTEPINDLRSEGEPGHFTGLAAKFNNLEQANELEVLLPGAFKRSLNNQKRFPLLWQHDPKEVIGSFTGYESGRGLEIDGRITMTRKGEDAYKLVKAGDMVGLSIGFQIVPDKSESRKNPDGTSYLYLREVKLVETSLVTWPWDKFAGIETIRQEPDTMSKEDWIQAKVEKLLAEGKNQDEAAAIANKMYDDMQKSHQAKLYVAKRLDVAIPESITDCIEHLKTLITHADPAADGASTQQQTENISAPGGLLYTATAAQKLAEAQQRFWRRHVRKQDQGAPDRTF